MMLSFLGIVIAFVGVLFWMRNQMQINDLLWDRIELLQAQVDEISEVQGKAEGIV